MNRKARMPRPYLKCSCRKPHAVSGCRCVTTAAGHMLQLESRELPAIAELLVLGRGARDRRRKPAELPEERRRERHVVRREEALVSRRGLVVAVHEIRDAMACRGIGVVAEAVHDAPAKQSLPVAGEFARESRQPVWRRRAVVVDEGEEVPACDGGAAIARGSRPRPRLSNEAQGEVAGVLRHDLVQRLGTAVVDDDDLEACTVVAEVPDAIEARAQLVRSRVRRNDDRDSGRTGVRQGNPPA